MLKPSAVAPLDAYILAEVMHDVGVPPGVFNMVTGAGTEVGEAIVAHPDIDMVSFTGSTSAGKRVARVAAETVKRVSLELGGKSANLLLDDLDEKAFSKAVRHGVSACFLNSGQTCTALTRLLVPRSRLAEAERIAAEEVETRFQAKDPFEEGGMLGPLASRAQVEQVQGYIRTGIDEGAKLVVGGPDHPAGVEEGGYYVQPTVFSEVNNDMVIAREEIFGPVLCILPYNDEEQAVSIANDTIYGLSGGVWAGDVERAKSVALRLRTGQVAVNGGRFNPLAPLGGYKQSGYGREYGTFGFEEFLQIKSLQM